MRPTSSLTVRFRSALAVARRLICVAGLLVPLAPATIAAAAGPGGAIRKGPFLQDIGPSYASVRVEVDPAASATLEVTEQGSPGPPPQTRVITSPEAFTVHTLRVTDLKPHTTY